jgi:cytochrome c biogenesis protein CcmG/thiol:disulfide interchange protein DsbE
LIIAALVVLGGAAAYFGLQPAPKAPDGVAGAAGGRPQQGGTVPDFTLPSVPGGTTVSLGAQKGKVVLVNFWATWCPPCRGEVPEFVKVQQELGPKGFQILGLSLDDGPDPVVDFIKAQGINYPVAMGAEMAGPYGGVNAIPSSFLLDRQGKLVQHFEGAIDGDTLRKAVEALL